MNPPTPLTDVLLMLLKEVSVVAAGLLAIAALYFGYTFLLDRIFPGDSSQKTKRCFVIHSDEILKAVIDEFNENGIQFKTFKDTAINRADLAYHLSNSG